MYKDKIYTEYHKLKTCFILVIYGRSKLPTTLRLSFFFIHTRLISLIYQFRNILKGRIPKTLHRFGNSIFFSQKEIFFLHVEEFLRVNLLSTNHDNYENMKNFFLNVF